jgi:hypothetical protein
MYMEAKVIQPQVSVYSQSNLLRLHFPAISQFQLKPLGCVLAPLACILYTREKQPLGRDYRLNNYVTT